MLTTTTSQHSKLSACHRDSDPLLAPCCRVVFFNYYLSNLCHIMKLPSPESYDSVFSNMSMVTGLKWFLNSFFHSPMLSSVWVHSSPVKPGTAWERPRFPFLSCQIVSQSSHSPTKSPFFMASWHFSRPRVLDFMTIKAPALLASWYLSVFQEHSVIAEP